MDIFGMIKMNMNMNMNMNINMNIYLDNSFELCLFDSAIVVDVKDTKDLPAC